MKKIIILLKLLGMLNKGIDPATASENVIIIETNSLEDSDIEYLNYEVCDSNGKLLYEGTCMNEYFQFSRIDLNGKIMKVRFQ